jgi:alkylhydroperoxidase family enzyme
MAFRVKEIDPTQVPALAALENQIGPSNFFRTMAYRPAAMADFARLYTDIMGTGTLDPQLKEMVYEVTARQAGITGDGSRVHTQRAGSPALCARDDALFTTEQLVELALIVSLANFTNRFSNGLGIPVEGMTAP